MNSGTLTSKRPTERFSAEKNNPVTKKRAVFLDTTGDQERRNAVTGVAVSSDAIMSSTMNVETPVIVNELFKDTIGS